MKHALRVLDDSGDPPPAGPLLVMLGDRLVSVVDAGGGVESRRFVAALLEAGAVPVDSPVGSKPHTRIVIRSTPKSPEARVRALALEASANVILGSVRPVFASYLGRLAPVG